ncbi:MAG: hypothetical protein DRN14_02930 [Thermoplasmata archaeon]|nr:MAG: hypothetical protein DRN14_02930 [Thermoplasmata archaeon]HDJ27216.1 hypothetical protein [Aciduliprofundum sp.]
MIGVEDPREIFRFIFALLRKLEAGEDVSPEEMRMMYKYLHQLSRHFGIVLEGILDEEEERVIHDMHFPSAEDLPGGTAS